MVTFRELSHKFIRGTDFPYCNARNIRWCKKLLWAKAAHPSALSNREELTIPIMWAVDNPNNFRGGRVHRSSKVKRYNDDRRSMARWRPHPQSPVYWLSKKWAGVQWPHAKVLASTNYERDIGISMTFIQTYKAKIVLPYEQKIQ